MAEVARGDRNRLRATIAAEEGAAVAAIEEEEGSDGRGGRGDGQMSCGRLRLAEEERDCSEGPTISGCAQVGCGSRK
ncbi:hypothetical protein BHE74_00025992 [Ensete ventricosum]|nr:hypothetical protein GW17_00030504 [Ensete ventricosum]RWW66632.1 hypothetical protein BHE74_00025992 [Ensete ventricosum]